MDHIELNCTISPREPFSDLIIAELAEIGYDMFEEHDQGFKAYIDARIYNETELEKLSWFMPNHFCNVSWSKQLLKHRNWNEEWENNFNPVIIAGKIHVRASFHPAQTGFEHEIVIQPKMSFGTGHHETTSLMMSRMLNLDLKKKSVLDMGCGSGILAILAGKLGASLIWAVDYDLNSTENTLENCNTNGFPNVIIKTGSTDVIVNQKFDIILANINRNIILEQLEAYCLSLKPNGILILSGFYSTDVPVIRKETEKLKLILQGQSSDNKWCELYFSYLK